MPGFVRMRLRAGLRSAIALLRCKKSGRIGSSISSYPGFRMRTTGGAAAIRTVRSHGLAAIATAPSVWNGSLKQPGRRSSSHSGARAQKSLDPPPKTPTMPHPPFKAIDHVQLAMPAGGENSARQFYGRLLGMAEIPKPDELAKRGGCWFERQCSNSPWRGE
jgi:hypothetical protein